jgi:hypothetical protein
LSFLGISELAVQPIHTAAHLQTSNKGASSPDDCQEQQPWVTVAEKSEASKPQHPVNYRSISFCDSVVAAVYVDQAEKKRR